MPRMYGIMPKTMLGSRDIKINLHLLIVSGPTTKSMPWRQFVYKYTSSLKQIAWRSSCGNSINNENKQPVVHWNESSKNSFPDRMIAMNSNIINIASDNIFAITASSFVVDASLNFTAPGI